MCDVSHSWQPIDSEKSVLFTQFFTRAAYVEINTNETHIYFTPFSHMDRQSNSGRNSRLQLLKSIFFLMCKLSLWVKLVLDLLSWPIKEVAYTQQWVPTV